MTGGYEQTWRARVSGEHRVVGAGILVASDLVLTCAHLISALLDTNPPGAAPTGQITVDFPGSTSRTRIGATVRADGWVPVDDDNGGDLALLALSAPPPPDVRPARLRRSGEPRRRRVRAFGHPTGLDGGVWTRAELVGYGGPSPGWVQFDGLDTSGRAVSAGFSGAGVVDEAGDVIGMVVAADRAVAGKVAWMIPTEVMIDRLPPLTALLTATRVDAASGSRALGWADVQRLARAISDLPVMSDEAARQLVVSSLPPTISGAIPRHSTLLIDVYGIVRTCLDHPGGLTELMSVIRAFAAGSVPLARVDQLIGEMGLDGA
jgi:S1-C subfamily serine protease